MVYKDSDWVCRKCGYRPWVVMGAIPICPRCGDEMFPHAENPEHPFKKGGPFPENPFKKY